MLLDITFIGYGAPADKTTMYLNAACGSSRAELFINKMAKTQIQPDGTWSLSATLLLPCRLSWRWRAENSWERRREREERLTASTSVILSNFSGQNQESKKLWYRHVDHHIIQYGGKSII